MKTIEINFDGGFFKRGDKSFGSYGYVIKHEGKSVHGAGQIEHEHMTVNVAEYLGLLKALQRVKKEIADVSEYEVIIRGDSKLVTETVGKRWGWKKSAETGRRIAWNPHTKFPHLQKMVHKVLDELKAFPKYQTMWIPREQNEMCDGLSKSLR